MLFRTKSCPTHLQPHGLLPARLLCPWDFPGKDLRVGWPFLPPEALSDPGIWSNACLLRLLQRQADSLPLSHLGSPTGNHINSYIIIFLCKKTLQNSYRCLINRKQWDLQPWRQKDGNLIIVLVTQSHPTLCNSMYYSLWGPPVHGILQARTLVVVVVYWWWW